MCVCVGGEVYVQQLSTGVLQGQKRASDLLQLELRMAVSCLTGMLETELRLLATETTPQTLYPICM